MNILLTGGNGFLGSNILKKLVSKDNFNIVVLVRRSSNLFRIQDLKGFELFYVDDNLINLNELFEKNSIDTIIHTATEYGRNSKSSLVFESNLLFPIKLIEAGLENKLKYFINTDTFSSKTIMKNTEYLKDYNTSKKYLLNFLNGIQDQINVVNLRLEHVFGEFDSENKFVNNIFNRLRRNEVEIILTDGLQKRDFIYMEDVVDVYLKVLEKIDDFGSFIEFEVGSGKSISVRRFVELLSEVTQSNTLLKFGILSKRKGEIEDSFANINGLKEIGWEPKYDLKSAIIRMIELESNII